MLSALFCCGQSLPVKNYNVEQGLSHSNVFRMYQDRKGFLWFCTNYGTCVFDGQRFEIIKNDSLLNGSAISISEDHSGNKLISTIREGVVVLTDSTVTRYKTTQGQIPEYVLYAVEKNDRLWIVAKIADKYIYEIYRNKVIVHQFKKADGSPINFSKICAYRDELLFTSEDGIYRVRDTTIERLLPTLVKGNVTDVRKDPQGTYWISSDNRLIAVSHEKIIYTYHFKPSEFINTIFCDRDNNVWISVYGKSLLLLKKGVIEDITQRLGLQTILINDFLQDNENNIWIATYDAGVYKLNGIDLLNYSTDKVQGHIFCRSIESFGKNKNLISSIGKMAVWENGVIRNLPVRTLKADEYIYFAKAYAGHIYLGTPNRLIIRNQSDREGASISFNIGSVSMCVDHTRKIWIGSFSCLYHLEGKTLVADSAAGILKHKRFNVIFEDRKNNIWMGTASGLIKFNGRQYAEVKLPVHKDFHVVRAITEDALGRIWVATEAGLLCFENNACRVFTTKNGLSHSKCNTLAIDRHNTLWVGTLRGLSYVDLLSLDVNHYGAGFYSAEVLSLCCSDTNLLLVGTASRLSSVKTRRIFADRSAPRVYITRIKTSTGETNMPLKASLPYDEKEFRIDFIGLSFQNENTVEYRYKIKGMDDSWHYTTNTSIDLPAFPSGHYWFELCARRNMGEWSQAVLLPIVIATPYWQTWWFKAIMAALVLTGIFLLNRWQIRRKELKKRQALSRSNDALLMKNKIAYLKQQALGALINPHFIFNCLNSIQHYLNKNDNDKANAYLADFAHLIRINIENAQDTFIFLDDELNRIKLYLSLEQLRAGPELLYEITVDPRISTGTTRIPSMVLQPYIENAIWHGIMPKKGKGRLLIAFFLNAAGEIKINIEDDGVGINNTTKKDSRRKQHFGMRFTAERLDLLKQLSGQNYQVVIKNREGGGTIVEIIIPGVISETVISGSEI